MYFCPTRFQGFTHLMRHFICVVSIANFFIHTSVADGSNPWGDWQEAKAHYDSQRFEEALKAFQEHPQENAAYHYNLGAVYYRLNKSGASLAHLEKANRMLPRDPDIQYNLSLVRNTLNQSLGADKLDPASSWVEALSDKLVRDEVLTIVSLLGFITILLWIRAFLNTQDLKKTLLNRYALISMVGFWISTGVFFVQRWGESYPPAISLQKQPIRSGPGNQFLELAQTEAGSKLRILGPVSNTIAENSQSTAENPESWRQVRFSRDGIGWVKTSTLLIFR